MSLKYENLKSKYLDLFDGNNDYFDYVMTDVIFVYEEISKIIEENKINKVLEVGSGTGIVLKELKDRYKDIEFVGLDPNQSGFHKHESVSKKLKQIDSAINIIKTSINNYDSEKKYDLIFSFNVFEHVSEQQKYLLKTYDLKKRDYFEIQLKKANIEFRRGNAGGGNQLRQPYIKNIVKNINLKNFKNVEHVHFFGYYIGNYPSLKSEKIKKLLNFLNNLNL